MLDSALEKILAGADLQADDAQQAFEAIMADNQAPVQVAAFLTGLRMKGETENELLGAARAMLQHAVRVEHRQDVLLDTCGTGGDGCGTFNISTTVAFVLAGAGLAVGKHGNRAITSKSGSADVLEALGARIDLKAEEVGQCIDEVGIGFMFAPHMHPAMKAVAPVRKELGFRTIFNLLGPLTNPARATAQVIGVFDGQYTELIARTATLLGVSFIATVYNSAGLDELAPLGRNRISTIENGTPVTRTISAEDVGMKECVLADLSGGDASGNARITRAILNGASGAAADTVCLNAGLALVTAGKVGSLTEGIELAQDTIADGSATRKLDEFVEKTRNV